MVKLCKYHYNRSASKNCEACGEGLCKYCGHEVNGKIYCKDCEKVLPPPKSYKFEV